MKKKSLVIRIAGLLILIGMALSMGGCKKISKDNEKIKDLEFTIVPYKDIPEELLEIIENEKEEVIRKTFTDKENLYIVSGYGTQPTTGYSIEVKELYETKNVIYIKTWLAGPDKGETVIEKITCPYIVVKIEYSDKRVVFK